MNENKFVFCMLHGIGNLFRAQTNIDVMQNGANHGDRKVRFQIAMAVPIHHCNCITGFDTGICQRIG